jgi:RimJ/RimL family protein N-acetyltransferase
VIIINNTAHGYAISEACGVVFNPAVDQVVARVKDGALLGGIVYQGYTGASIQMHTAGFAPNWANREFLWAIFDYPFNQLDCRKVFGQVPETNVRALEIDLKLGFKIVAKIDDVFPDGACYVLALAREDCRWLNLKPRGVFAGMER